MLDSLNDLAAEMDAEQPGSGDLFLAISTALMLCGLAGRDYHESIDLTTEAFVKSHGDEIHPVIIAATVLAVANLLVSRLSEAQDRAEVAAQN
jgi:hypothetical protein